MKIDLHVHSKEYSFCGRSAAEAQIQAAITAGLDALVFADHDQLFPQQHLQLLNAKYAPFRIFGGIEMSVDGEHLLVLGVHDESLERRRWSYPALHEFIRNQQGFIALNHPFRFNEQIEINHRQFPPDAIEAYSNNIITESEQRILTVAQELGVYVVSNSDAHHISDLGRYYNVLNHSPADEHELIQLLKDGEFTCVFP